MVEEEEESVEVAERDGVKQERDGYKEEEKETTRR